MRPTLSDAVISRVRAEVAARDPLLIEAVNDVDRSLVRAWLDRDPWERVRLTAERADEIEALKSWQQTG